MSARHSTATRICQVLGVALLIAVAAAAQQDATIFIASDGRVAKDLPPSQPQVTVHASDMAGLDATVVLSSLVLRAVETPGGRFVEVGGAEAALEGQIGAPALPVLRRLLVAPDGATVTLAAQASSPVIVHLPALGLPSRIIPAQPPVEKIPGALENAAFAYDEAAYAVAASYPAQRARIEELGILRGQRLLLLTVYPVAYNPAEQLLRFYPEIAVQVRFDGGRHSASPVPPWPRLGRLVLNPEVLPPAGRGSGNYLIVVASDYQSGIAAFAAEKSAQGFDVTTWVPPSADKTLIKNYIQSLWGGPNSPDYLLLVGDTDTIPHWTGGGSGSPPTDLPYACMDGSSDWYPDMAYGRFPVRSAAHLQAIVDKTLLYQSGAWADPDYVNRAVFMASADNYTVSEGTHNWVINNYMIPNGIISDKLYCHTYNATTQQVRNAFNGGRFFGIFSGHGEEYSWADGPPFSQTDVNNLTNAGMYAFVCSFACLTGNYTKNECFTETWIRVADKGALAIYGSSVTSYWTEDDVLEKRLFDAIYDIDDDVPGEVGPVWIDTLMRYLVQMGAGSTTRRYFEMYNLMGDPSLRFPGAANAALTISFPNELPRTLTPNEPTDITVRVVSQGENYVPGSGLLHYRYDGLNWHTSPLVPLGGELYRATLPAAHCNDTPEYYFSAQGDGGTTIYNPKNAPAEVYTALVGTLIVVFEDNFDTDKGWTVYAGADTGNWERAQPQQVTSSGVVTQPGMNDIPSPTYCYVTGPLAGGSAGAYDVDGGPTILTSPVLDMPTGGTISYWRWYHISTTLDDEFVIQVSNDNGASWVTVETITNRQTWTYVEWNLADYVTPSSQVRVRFIADDTPNNSLVEALIDDFVAFKLECVESEYPLGDLNCDGLVDGFDIQPFVLAVTDPAAYEAQYPHCNHLLADINQDGNVDGFDIQPFVGLLTGS